MRVPIGPGPLYDKSKAGVSRWPQHNYAKRKEEIASSGWDWWNTARAG
ncbi:MAG: hypothetical protein QOH42_956, partial [Blastocatellia bacterium]|nr:hypothetical protein [Blastocatellia bacterium]